jgi:hypothetical protein
MAEHLKASETFDIATGPTDSVARGPMGQLTLPDQSEVRERACFTVQWVSDQHRKLHEGNMRAPSYTGGRKRPGKPNYRLACACCGQIEGEHFICRPVGRYTGGLDYFRCAECVLTARGRVCSPDCATTQSSWANAQRTLLSADVLRVMDERNCVQDIAVFILGSIP